ncbi:glycosyl hydrolase family 3 N terminal domain-containing protein [Lactifluus volemus]|nr:glycosyl hydrolase family 3 N terminal domain-containing protein [Lactifluus volemus]
MTGPGSRNMAPRIGKEPTDVLRTIRHVLEEMAGGAEWFGTNSAHVGNGVNMVLGPVINMGRVAQSGRNWEGFGADPFLTGVGACESILGIQYAGAQTCASTFINNTVNRRTSARRRVRMRITGRSTRFTSRRFLHSVMAGLTSVMCSFNLVNGTYVCQSNRTLNGILKEELGFQGFVMSDWAATESTSAMYGHDHVRRHHVQLWHELLWRESYRIRV